MEEVVAIFKDNNEIRNEAKKALTNYRSENLINQSKIGERLVAIMPGIKEAFYTMGDEIYELGIENDQLKMHIGEENLKKIKERQDELLDFTNKDYESKKSYILDKMKRRVNTVKILKKI